MKERLVFLAEKCLVRLPRPKSRLSHERSKKIKGKTVSALITGGRR